MNIRKYTYIERDNMNITIDKIPQYNNYKTFNKQIKNQPQAEQANLKEFNSANILTNYNKVNINFKGAPATSRAFQELVWLDNPEMNNVIKYVNEKVFPYHFENNKILKKDDLNFLKKCFNYFWSEKSIKDDVYGTYSAIKLSSFETCAKLGAHITDEARHVLMTLDFNLNRTESWGKANIEVAEKFLENCKKIVDLKEHGKHQEARDFVKQLEKEDPIYKMCQYKYYRP